MKKKLFNLFLFVAVPVVTGFKFRVVDINYGDIAIIGNRTGLPAIWDQKYLYKHWWDIKTLKQCELETEAMSYKDFSKGILADDEVNIEELLSFASHNDCDLCMNDLISK
jgi:hypothetical protein